jgi:hypothetical protein
MLDVVEHPIRLKHLTSTLVPRRHPGHRRAADHGDWVPAGEADQPRGVVGRVEGLRHQHRRRQHQEDHPDTTDALPERPGTRFKGSSEIRVGEPSGGQDHP